MKIISNIFYTIFITLLLGVAGLFLMPLLPIDSAVEMRIVESGSMEPAITTGSLVMIMPTAHYNVGDVVTFLSRSSDVPTTHRITAIAEEGGRPVFTTKGDANEEADTNTVAERDILGKVQASVPYAGFILDFARQPLGFALLIVLPALMIIVSEIEKIWREIRKRRHDKNDGTPITVTRATQNEPEVEVREIVRMIEIGRPVFLYETITQVRHLSVRSAPTNTHNGLSFGEIAVSVCLIMTSICFTSVSFVGSTISYFNDTESSLKNIFRATALDFNVLSGNETSRSLQTDFIDGEGTLITVVEGEDESAEATYTVVTEKMGGSDLFCGSILASSQVPLVYDGPLILLADEGVSFDSPWELSFSVAPDVSGLVPNEVCLIDIVYTAWNAASESGVGYSDVERVQLKFYAPTPTLEAFGGASLLEETVPLLLEDETTLNDITEPVIPPSDAAEEPTGDLPEDVPSPEELIVEESSTEESPLLQETIAEGEPTLELIPVE